MNEQQDQKVINYFMQEEVKKAKLTIVDTQYLPPTFWLILHNETTNEYKNVRIAVPKPYFDDAPRDSLIKMLKATWADVKSIELKDHHKLRMVAIIILFDGYYTKAIRANYKETTDLLKELSVLASLQPTPETSQECIVITAEFKDISINQYHPYDKIKGQILFDENSVILEAGPKGHGRLSNLFFNP